mmetsp:Transcript_16079/g.44246  ORF Transcript_16079/g.44246 Transcript_16079/m.44246 type:complete len:99 (+) Transcript_16079:499-795(+)
MILHGAHASHSRLLWLYLLQTMCLAMPTSFTSPIVPRNYEARAAKLKALNAAPHRLPHPPTHAQCRKMGQAVVSMYDYKGGSCTSVIFGLLCQYNLDK